MRGAHPEHVAHVRDAGRVEAQRLVERLRGLPSRKEGARCGARCGPGGERRRAAAVHERQGERTWNMSRMFVTLDVSKPSGWLNALATYRVERRACDAGRGVGRGREGIGRRQRTSGMHGVRARLWRLGG